MQEFFKKWQEQSTKSFDEFLKYCDDYFLKNISTALFRYRQNDDGSIDILLDDYELPFEMLFGVINKFFREYDILFIAPTYSEFGWGFCVGDILDNERFNDYMEHRIENPEKATMLAILKSAEILENIL